MNQILRAPRNKIFNLVIKAIIQMKDMAIQHKLKLLDNKIYYKNNFSIKKNSMKNSHLHMKGQILIRYVKEKILNPLMQENLAINSNHKN